MGDETAEGLEPLAGVSSKLVLKGGRRSGLPVVNRGTLCQCCSRAIRSKSTFINRKGSVRLAVTSAITSKALHRLLLLRDRPDSADQGI